MRVTMLVPFCEKTTALVIKTSIGRIERRTSGLRKSFMVEFSLALRFSEVCDQAQAPSTASSVCHRSSKCLVPPPKLRRERWSRCKRSLESNEKNHNV